jgi:hypothetical protein
VYLYGTDNVDQRHDDIDSKVIVPTSDPLPHVQVTDVSEVISGELTISGTVFSSVANIASVKAVVFPSGYDLDSLDQANLADFVNTNGTDLSITSDQYAVGNVSGASLSSYFSNIDTTVTNTLVSGTSYKVAMSAEDITGNVGVGVYVVPDPFAGVASLSFRTSTAIADLADGTYSSMTFNGTSVSGINVSGVHTFSASGFTIQTDSNDKRYFTVSPPYNTRYAFGRFNLGVTDFTIIFVISCKHAVNTDSLTYGVYPDDKFNIHIGRPPQSFGFYDPSFPYTQVSTTQQTNYLNASYLLKMVSYKHSTNTLTIMFRTDTSNTHHQEFNVSHTFVDSQERAFTLTASSDPHRIYDLMIFPGEYMTSDRATYPLFGTIEDYVSSEYGILPP